MGLFNGVRELFDASARYAPTASRGVQQEHDSGEGSASSLIRLLATVSKIKPNSNLGASSAHLVRFGVFLLLFLFFSIHYKLFKYVFYNVSIFFFLQILKDVYVSRSLNS